MSWSTIPSTLRRMELTWAAKATTLTSAVALLARVNGDTGANYQYTWSDVSGTPASSLARDGVVAAETRFHLGYVPGMTTSTDVQGIGTAEINGWNRAPLLHAMWRSHVSQSTTATWYFHAGGTHHGSGANTSILLYPDSGSFVAGSEFVLAGYE